MYVFKRELKWEIKESKQALRWTLLYLDTKYLIGKSSNILGWYVLLSDGRKFTNGFLF